MLKRIEEESFGDFFRRLRKSRGFKWQKDLAEASGVSQTTISRIEDNTQKPQGDTLKELSKALDISYTELMVLAGYWDEEELLEPIDKESILNKSNIPSMKKTPSDDDFSTEKEFLSNVDLSDEELTAQYRVMLDGRILTDNELKNLVAFVRTLRNTKAE